MSLYGGYFAAVMQLDPSGLTEQCCENGTWVDKVTVKIVNRGGKESGTMGGHIDLIIPGCGIGMVGFFGDQSEPWDAPDENNEVGSVVNNVQGGIWGIPGVMNITEADWNRKPKKGGRAIYTQHPGMNRKLIPGKDNKGNVVPIHYTENPLSWICEFEVCPADAKKMCKKAKEIRKNPGSFRMAGRNCSTMGCQVLNSGGVGPAGINWIDNPQNLIKESGSKKCYWGYTVAMGKSTLSPYRSTAFTIPVNSNNNPYRPQVSPNHRIIVGPAGAQVIGKP